MTSPARTVFDIAPRLTDKALTRAVNDLRIARRLRPTTSPSYWPGSRDTAAHPASGH